MPKGFTLLELLIVIAILAILATTVVLILNPAEAVKRARDTQRISDLDAIKTAIILWITDGHTDVGATICKKAGTSFHPCKSNECKGAACDGKSSSAIDGEGWIPIKFTDMTGGSPLSHLPVDPVNSGDYLYYYAASGTDFELNARMESRYYRDKNPIMEKDGGNSDKLYEIGTDLTIYECVKAGPNSPDCADEATNTRCLDGECKAP